MADHGGGDHDGRLADQPHAVAEIDVLAVAEQPLVEAPQLQEEVPVHQHGPAAGREHLAAAIGEARDTIEDVLEPYLIQQGYLQRTLRGRIATPAVYRHLGLAEPASAVVRDLLSEE